MSDDGTLVDGLERYGFEFDLDQVELLDCYRRALWEWNEKLNLTRHTTIDKFVGRDVVDSIALEPFLEPGCRVLDVGTGGGVPGMILSIARPDLQITVCESVAKRARAALAIRDQAKLDVRVEHARGEQLLEGGNFDILVARAVAPLVKILRWLGPHWDSFRELLLIKGPGWVEERRAAREAGLLAELELRKLAEHQSPQTGASSVVLRVRPK
ncbi:MAG: RsmG family class I SAM-dependent methyltransferase [Pirellulales bacterium]